MWHTFTSRPLCQTAFYFGVQSMTIKSSFEISIDKRIDVVLAWLEKDITETLGLERFEAGDLSISFYVDRRNNLIEINSRIFERSKKELHEGESVARYEVSR